jgi:predicted permease
MSRLHGALARLRLLFAPRAAEARMEEEFRFHLEMEAEKHARAGLPPDEARRRAAAAFGRVDTHREVMRDGRGLDLRGGWALDLTLGWRALRKYPLINTVTGVAIAFAIAVAAIVNEGVTQVLHPRLPLPEGDRVVGLRLWNAASGEQEWRSLHYYARWRGALRTLPELGAFTEGLRSLGDRPGGATPAMAAAITASGFRVARAAPQLGRAFTDADERPGAPPVVILAYHVWQQRFAGDPNIVGRSVRLGGEPHTVIGVMPEGFLFPIRHELWTPLRTAPAGYEPGEGPPVWLLGRLAPGATLDDARRELDLLGTRSARDLPPAWAQVRPRVMPYADLVMGLDSEGHAAFWSIQLFTVLLLVLASANVALLVFARAATREGEIVVRTALGATRRRIVAQLFAESLVLSAIAGGVALAVANFGMGWAQRVVLSEVVRTPFWFRDSLSASTVAYGVLLAILSAVIAGALPGAKVTRALAGRLRAAGAGGGGLRLGRAWGVVIAAQVTVAVLFPVTTYFLLRDLSAYRSLDLGYAAEEYVVARLGVDVAEGAPVVASPSADSVRAERAAAIYRTLRERVAAQPGVTAVTFTDRVPGMWHPRVRVEVEAAGTPMPDSIARKSLSVAFVDADYFAALGAGVRSGRGFRPADLGARANVVVVNASFVRHFAQGRDPVGWRLRYPNPEAPQEPRRPDQPPGPWYEIVGVVPDLAMHSGGRDPRPHVAAGLYHVAEPGRRPTVHMAVRVRGRNETFVSQLHHAATSVDPSLRVEASFPAHRITEHEQRLSINLLRLSAVLGAMALLVSVAAIYAVTAFDVGRRTREIGVRVALGSDRRRIVGSVLARPLVPVGSGVLVGTVLTMLFVSSDHDLGFTPAIAVAVLAYDALMLAVCTLGCAAPARRALRIDPMQVLKAE